MRYYDAYRMDKWLFTRCGECAALVAEIDQETHTEWHESAQRRVEQLRQMYGYVIDKFPVVTKSGKVLTDDDIQALVDEAEAGYDVEELKRKIYDEMGQ